MKFAALRGGVNPEMVFNPELQSLIFTKFKREVDLFLDGKLGNTTEQNKTIEAGAIKGWYRFLDIELSEEIWRSIICALMDDDTAFKQINMEKSTISIMANLDFYWLSVANVVLCVNGDETPSFNQSLFVVFSEEEKAILNQYKNNQEV